MTKEEDHKRMLGKRGQRWFELRCNLERLLTKKGKGGGLQTICGKLGFKYLGRSAATLDDN